MTPLPLNVHTLEGSLYRYTFVGRGAQFRVYGVSTLDGRSTGRVIKVPLDFAETKRAIFEPLRLLQRDKSEDELDELADRRTREVMAFKHDVPNLLQGVMGSDRYFVNRLGNMKMLQMPVSTYEDRAVYSIPTLFTQDLVMTLDEYLQKFRLARNHYVRTLDYRTVTILHSVVDQIIQLNYMIWEYGVFEFVFKPENFGIRMTKTGKPELIWIDLAEHITNYEQAQSILSEKRWLHPLQAHKVDYQFMPLILVDYYADTCNKAFTKKELEKRWRRKCRSVERKHAGVLRVKELMEINHQKKVSLWIARHNLRESLHRGFPDSAVDDMQIPISDVEMLIADTSPLSMGGQYPEEQFERRLAEAGETQQIMPLIIPGRLLSHKERP
jgi:hypothetical protein